MSSKRPCEPSWRRKKRASKCLPVKEASVDEPLRDLTKFRNTRRNLSSDEAYTICSGHVPVQVSNLGIVPEAPAVSRGLLLAFESQPEPSGHALQAASKEGVHKAHLEPCTVMAVAPSAVDRQSSTAGD